MKQTLVLFAFIFFSLQIIAQTVKSPQEFLGYEIGTRFTRHADVVRYFEHVAQNSDLVEYQTYGETNEHRPLTYAVVSSTENLENLEEIRTNHLRNTGIEGGSYNAANEKAIVWLSYNVHGNESSSTEASMKTLYELVTSKKELLDNTVVIIDPTVNPDGRDRYANWYNQVKAEPYNSNPMAVEHNEPWPGGRANHYLFDLNRDWAWATQAETRHRLKVYNQWMPHIHVDFHEQGINEPYYFAPAAEPFHEVITPFQREFQKEIGLNHAKYFDEEGWLYFTKERFDLLYPSYGDTYPTYLGSIGMTYEKAGGGRAGLGIETTEGNELTLKDRVEHHHTTGLSTVEVADKNVGKLNQEFGKFFKNENQQTKSFAVSGNADKIASLKRLLDLHEIKYENASPGNIKGFNYSKNNNSGLNVDQNALVIHTSQPKGKMVKALFEPSAKLSDSLTYDITAWSVPHAYGLNAVASSRNIPTGTAAAATSVNNTPNPSGAAYLTKWNSLQDAQFLAALLKAGIKVRFSELPFENANQKFNRGSLVITKSDNRSVENFDGKVVEIANNFNRQLTSAASGFNTSGPDFGSSDVKNINAPRIGVLRGEGTSSLNYGEIWHFFEQQLEYPITSVDTDYFSSVDLNKLDVLILPSGNYSDIFKEKDLEKIKSWVKAGGKVIAIGNAVSYFAGKEGFDLKENKPATKKDTTGNLIPYANRERESIKDLITGSIVKTTVDNTHPLAYGYDDTYFSLKLSSNSYSFLKDGYNVGILKGEPEIISGFAGSEAKKNIKNSLTFGVEPMGKGSFIYLVDNPLFRSFWENGKLFFVNSIFLVNNENMSR